MNRLIDPPGIKIAVQRMVCTSCGAEANASCTCGVAYVPKSVRATEALKANPEKSDRALAAEAGVSHTTIQKVRHQLATELPPAEERVGQDGKSYPATQPPIEPKPVDEESLVIKMMNGPVNEIRGALRKLSPPMRISARRQILNAISDAMLKERDEIAF